MMKNPLIDLCSEFSRQARFRLALIPRIPNDDILRAMNKEGWRLKQPELSTTELVARASATGYGCMPLPLCSMENPKGQDVFTEPDPAIYKEYRETVRRTAAQLYGITLK